MDATIKSSSHKDSGLSDTPQVMFEELSLQNQLKMDFILEILHEGDVHLRADKIRTAAKTLGVHRTTVTRLVNRYETSGLSGVVKAPRSDKGQYRISEFWQKFIIDKYKDGQKHSRRICRNQIALQVKAHAEQILHLKRGEYPSHTTVYKILEPFVKKENKYVRNPGQGVSRVINTTKGVIELTHSNQVWQSDHTEIDLLVVGQDGEMIGRPWLTTIIDSYSGCVMGYRLGFEAPGAFEVGLALRHAILPKTTDIFRQWAKEWDLYGVPTFLFTDHGRDFEAEHTQRIGRELGFEARFRTKPEDGGAVESPFGKINTEILAYLPGYTDSDTKKRPKNAEKSAIVTFQEIETLLTQYFAVHFNGHSCPRVRHQTRLERWNAMLLTPAQKLSERDLDTCLLKKMSRRVEKSGAVNFSALKYRGNLPKEIEGESISIRYDPRNIARILAYSRAEEDQASCYLGVLQSDRFDDEISLKEWELLKQRERKQAQNIDNSALLQERLNLMQFSEEKVGQLKEKERRRKAQKQLDKEKNQSKVSELHPKKQTKAQHKSKVSKTRATHQKRMMQLTEAELKELRKDALNKTPFQEFSDSIIESSPIQTIQETRKVTKAPLARLATKPLKHDVLKEVSEVPIESALLPTIQEQKVERAPLKSLD